MRVASPACSIVPRPIRSRSWSWHRTSIAVGKERGENAMAVDETVAAATTSPVKTKRRLPPEISILGVLVGLALIFEVLGWIFIGQSFLLNPERLRIIILQMSVI